MHEFAPPENDGLYIPPPVGEWSRAKHHFLWRYLNAFTTAMKDKEWSGLHYIDLFAGAGIEEIRGSGELTWGSPLLAAQATHPFTRIHLCEKRRRRYDALAKRMHRIQHEVSPQIIHGDANANIDEVVAEIPPRALSLAFMDPYGLHLHFSTVKALAARRADLIVFFPDRLDALRNWKIYDTKPNSNLDRFLGEGVDWRAGLLETPKDRWAEVLRNLYVGQLRTLGYEHFEYERVFAERKPLYLLIFCSHHEAGARIWRGVAAIKPDAQRSFDFGD